MATLWTEEKKKQWILDHPCKRKAGRIAKSPHKDGKCVNCGGCITCKAPPWCPEHRKIAPVKRQFSDLFSIEDNMEDKTPAKRLRKKPPRVSPHGIVQIDREIEAKMDELDEDADDEKAEGNLLGYRFMNELNKLEDSTLYPTYRKKVKKLASIVNKQLRHLCNNDPDKEIIGMEILMNNMCSDVKGMTKLADNACKLAAIGSKNTRRMVLPLLLVSFTDKEARRRLKSTGYSEVRMERAATNRRAKNGGEIDRQICEFKTPVSNHGSNAKHRKNFQILLQGKDLE